MTKNKEINGILEKVGEALHRSDEAILASNNLLKELDKTGAEADGKYREAQAAVDQDIERIAQEMDEAMVQFVADTE